MTPGQAAFVKWVSLLNVPYPINWQQMPARGKAAWEEVAEAAIQCEISNSTKVHDIGS